MLRAVLPINFLLSFSLYTLWLQKFTIYTNKIEIKWEKIIRTSETKKPVLKIKKRNRTMNRVEK